MSGRGVGEGVNVIFGRRVERDKRKERMMVTACTLVVKACEVGRKMD